VRDSFTRILVQGLIRQRQEPRSEAGKMEKETEINRLAVEHSEWLARYTANIVYEVVKEAGKQMFRHGAKHREELRK